MIGNKLEQDILSIYNRDITAVLSINQIAKKLNKAYPYIHSKVNQLIEEGVLIKTQVGRSFLCSLNLNNDKALLLLSLNEVSKKEKFLKKTKFSIKLLTEIDSIKKNFKIYSIFIHNKSLIFVLDHIHDKEAIKNKYSSIKFFKLDFLSKSEFQESLLRDKNYLLNHIILYSFETFFELIQEIQDQIMAKHFLRK